MTDAGQGDAALVRAARRGEARAFEQLVERHKSLVFAVCLASTGDGSEAEDVAQEAFLSARRTLGRLRELESLRPWQDPPSDLASRGLHERWRRAFVGRGDAFEAALAKELGPDRAHELRAADNGWPSELRMRMVGCAAEDE